jgi:hypothetical protein
MWFKFWNLTSIGDIDKIFHAPVHLSTVSIFSDIASRRSRRWIAVNLDIIYSVNFTYPPPDYFSLNLFWLPFCGYVKKVLYLFNMCQQSWKKDQGERRPLTFF